MAKNNIVSGFYFFNSYMPVFDILRSSVKKWKLLEAVHLYAVCGKKTEFNSKDLNKCFGIIKYSIDSCKKSKKLDVVNGEKKKNIKNSKKVFANNFEDCKEDFDKCVDGLEKNECVILPENKRGFARMEQELNKNGSILVENCFDNINNIQIKLNNNSISNLKEKEILKKKKDENRSSVCVSLNNKTPTLDDISDYVQANNLIVSPEEFFNYYESTGWKCAGQPIINWKAKCRGWHVKRAGNNSSLVKSDISERVYNKGDLNGVVTDSWECFIRQPFD